MPIWNIFSCNRTSSFLRRSLAAVFRRKEVEEEASTVDVAISMLKNMNVWATILVGFVLWKAYLSSSVLKVKVKVKVCSFSDFLGIFGKSPQSVVPHPPERRKRGPNPNTIIV